MTSETDISVIMVTHNNEHSVGAALDSTGSIDRPFEVIVVDNRSADGTVRCATSAAPMATMVSLNSNVGFAKACNLAAGRAAGRLLLFLNPDTVLLPGAVARAAGHLERNPTIGVVGGRTLFEDGSTNITCCFREPSLWSAFCYATGLSSVFRRSSLLNPEQMRGWDRADTRSVDVVTGCFLMIERSLFEKLRGFDERFFLYSEDTDLCRRVRDARLSCVHLADASLIHSDGGSEPVHSAKLTKVFAARSRYYAKHWSPRKAAIGRQLLDFAVLGRLLVNQALRRHEGIEHWADVWHHRDSWGAGDKDTPSTDPSVGPELRIKPKPVECHLRIAFRLLRHAMRSAGTGNWDFVGQGIRSLLSMPVLMTATALRAPVHTCNVCGWSGPRFYPNSGPGYDERDTICPGCLSQDRHRSLLALLTSQTTFFLPGSRVIEVAPVRGFEALVRRQPEIDYTSIDLERRAMERGDITDMRFDDGTVDYLICFHVLEHVCDHHAAVKEIRRVLAPDGTAVFQVPVDWEAETTFEYGAPDPRDVGHVRRYGRDFGDFLASHGLEVHSLSVIDHFSTETIRRFGLSPEPIFFARPSH